MKKEDIRLEILQQRINHGMSQSELAKLMGVSQRSVSVWENGEAIPRNTTCIKLANAFGLPRDYFIPDGEESLPSPKSEDAAERPPELSDAIDTLIRHYGDIDTAVTQLKKLQEQDG